MKKNLAMGAYTALIYVIVLSWIFSSCSRPERHQVEEVKTNISNSCNWEYLGRIGAGHRGDFDLFKFEVNGKTFIAGSEYNGGLDIVQISE